MDLKQSLIKFCHYSLYALMCILLLGAGVYVLIKAESGFEVFVGIAAILIALCNVALGFVRISKRNEEQKVSATARTTFDATTTASAKAKVASTASSKKTKKK